MAVERVSRGALAAMWVGLVLTVVAAAYPFVDRGLLADHIRAGYPAYSATRVDSAVGTYLVLLSVIGVLGVLAWSGSVWMVKAGKRWARPVATVLFVLGISVGLTGLLVQDTSGGTGLPPAVGWAGMAPCLAGVVAVALLWTRPSRVSAW